MKYPGNVCDEEISWPVLQRSPLRADQAEPAEVLWAHLYWDKFTLPATLSPCSISKHLLLFSISYWKAAIYFMVWLLAFNSTHWFLSWLNSWVQHCPHDLPMTLIPKRETGFLFLLPNKLPHAILLCKQHSLHVCCIWNCTWFNTLNCTLHSLFSTTRIPLMSLVRSLKKDPEADFQHKSGLGKKS